MAKRKKNNYGRGKKRLPNGSRLLQVLGTVGVGDGANNAGSSAKQKSLPAKSAPKQKGGKKTSKEGSTNGSAGKAGGRGSGREVQVEVPVYEHLDPNIVAILRSQNASEALIAQWDADSEAETVKQKLVDGAEPLVKKLLEKGTCFSE